MEGGEGETEILCTFLSLMFSRYMSGDEKNEAQLRVTKLRDVPPVWPGC